ncbi:MAG: Thivi_2564 family membrane protein [Methylocystis sp.]|uniref:Thivi_2564 family membrane protein n=1 Tax=Methylocystis sp. TaxID=1911079 RepID=UPI003DA4BBC7
MSIITILIVLVIAGVLLYLLNVLIPLDPKIRTVINVLVGLVLFLWIVGLLTGHQFIKLR